MMDFGCKVVKLLPPADLTPQDLAASQELKVEVKEAAPKKGLPPGTPADRAYSRKLLEGIGLPAYSLGDE
jgi:hypothetical protein